MQRKFLLLLIPMIFIIGCDKAVGNVNATDPVERGCSYIAAAIITSAVIRAVCNK